MKCMVSRAVMSLLAMALLAAPAAAGAQQTKPPATQAATHPQAASNKDASPDEPRQIIQWRDRYAKLKDSGIALSAGSIVSGSAPSAGVILGKRRTVGIWGAVVEARWSLRGYRQVDGEVGMTGGRRHRTELRTIDTDATSMFNQNSLITFGSAVFLHVRELRYPRVDYYGPAAAASKAGRSDYGLQGGSIDLVGQWQRRHIGASARFGTLRLHLETPTNDGLPDTRDLYAAAGVPGLAAQHPFRTIGAGVTIDFRDQPQLTERGTFAGVALWRAHETGGVARALDWSRLNADVQHFVRVKKGRQVIALRGVLSVRLDEGSTPLPFYLQPTLGGGKTLRGFGSYRLRDESTWSGNAEYRWRVHPRVEIAPFVDFGAAAPRFGDFRRTKVEVSPGLGVRAVGGSRIVARLDYAHSREGSRVMLALGAPF
jgi:hypothetical protein